MKQSTKSVLPEELTRLLASSLAPAALPSARVDALWHRLQSRIAASADAASTRNVVSIRAPLAADAGWEDLGGGVRRRILIDTPSTFAWLFGLDAGASIPPHTHEADESCWVLAGDVWLDQTLLKQGDFHFAPAGSVHSVVRTEHGCTLYLSTTPSA